MSITDLVLSTASEEYLDTSVLTERIVELNASGTDVAALLGAAIGMSGEAGEFSELVKKCLFQRKPLDRDHAIKELGDIRWYFALACMALDVTTEEVDAVVTEKLLKRFKNGFTVEDNINRKEGDI